MRACHRPINGGLKNFTVSNSQFCQRVHLHMSCFHAISKVTAVLLSKCAKVLSVRELCIFRKCLHATEPLHTLKMGIDLTCVYLCSVLNFEFFRQNSHLSHPPEQRFGKIPKRATRLQDMRAWKRISAQKLCKKSRRTI